MSKIKHTYTKNNGVTVELEMMSVEELLQDVGLDDDGYLQTFHTNNALRRILKYMANRTGTTLKIVIAQTDIRKPRIVMDFDYARMLFTGFNHKNTEIKYTKAKHPLAGKRPDLAVSAAEGKAMAEDIMREMKRGRR